MYVRRCVWHRHIDKDEKRFAEKTRSIIVLARSIFIFQGRSLSVLSCKSINELISKKRRERNCKVKEKLRENNEFSSMLWEWRDDEKRMRTDFASSRLIRRNQIQIRGAWLLCKVRAPVDACLPKSAGPGFDSHRASLARHTGSLRSKITTMRHDRRTRISFDTSIAGRDAEKERQRKIGRWKEEDRRERERSGGEEEERKNARVHARE